MESDLTPGPSLPGDLDVDVAIVGGGFTGLWTAYYLLVADPTLRVAVLEREIAGFGASGRNGGWCSALLPQSPEGIADRHGDAAAVAMTRAMQATVDEVGLVTRVEHIDADYAKGGTVVVARNQPQLARARAEVAASGRFGLDLSWLSPEQARERLGATDVLGATYTPHCAAIHPAKLVRGLAAVVRERGAAIYEQTPVTSIEPGLARTPLGTVRAEVVVRATEAYTPGLKGLRRSVVPLYSLMVATQPLPASFWERAGLRSRETFADFRRLIIYGQRTADDRLAFGGRGAPYHWGSAVAPGFDRVHSVHAMLHRDLLELFPYLGDARITHAWGGPLAAPRDWSASVGLDRRTGLAWAGGYVGDGVATANLAGRTLADLIRGVSSELTTLPWVRDTPPRSWEPEPLRWLGINTSTSLMASADRVERRTNRPARRADLIDRLLGH